MAWTKGATLWNSVGGTHRLNPVRGRLSFYLPALAAGRTPDETIAGQDHIVAVALQLEPIGEQVQAHRIVQVPTEAAEEGQGLGILHLALGVIDTDAATVRVIEGAALVVSQAEHAVEVSVTIGGQTA